MPDLEETIRKSGSKYLTETEISRFIREIDRWKQIVSRSFFQLTQSGDSASLEFSAHGGEVVIDVTANKGQISVSVIPVSSINAAVLRDVGDITQLVIGRGGTGAAMTYTAAAEEFRSALREYGYYIQSLLSTRKS